ncbi:MAG: glycoside hydrolase family 30 protein [Solirubrobacteraceae bacterium]
MSALLALVTMATLVVWVVVQLGSADAGPWDLDVHVVQTSADLSQRLSRMPDRLLSGRPPHGVPVIDVDDGVRYQRIQGVGGAMTDSSAWLIRNQLDAATRSRLLNNLFGSSAAGLSFVRLPIAASDFTATAKPYSYDDLPAGATDPHLSHFSIAHDDAYIVPAMRTVMQINPSTSIIATPWSPPPWMKTNDSFENVGLKGHLLPGDWSVLANYFVRFVQAYARRGIPIAAVAPQNEPRAPANYPAMSFAAANQAKWIAQDLRPALKAAQLPTKIYAGETSFSAPSYALSLAKVKQSGLDGISQHCYRGAPSLLGQLHDANPSLRLVVSECALQLTPYSASEIAIGAMRNWASAVGLWNLALDPSGGPVEEPNTGCGGCKGIVTIDPQTQRVTYNLPYYQLGQIGRFVKPGAQRVDSNHFVSYYLGTGQGNYGTSQGVDDLAARNPDGTVVLVAYNNTTSDARFAVRWRGRSFTYQLPAHATVTFSWNHPA